MAQTQDGNNELVLNPIQYAFVLDKTKGIINNYVGPTKQQIAPNTEQPIKFNRQSRRFEDCSLKDAVQEFITADEGSYIILEGTTKDNTPPQAGVANMTQKVDMGRKIMLPGPTAFSLWAGQVATVVSGHHLKTNEYLICRVYNDDEAKKNWNKAILRKRNQENTGQTQTTAVAAPDFVMGSLLIIKGTEVAYFVPPTGIEVLPQSPGALDFTRSAVTLEKPDYCILLSESGHKRYVQGPAVVFPEPTETFFTKNENGVVVRKFKAFELNENMGLHIKVIETYKEGDKTFKEGDELFITGKEQPIYFPRKEHSIIRYGRDGDQDIQYAVAIPTGEGRYVLDKTTGKVELVTGPRMFLADPRTQVIVRKVLSEKECDLYFPGNEEALNFNLSQLAAQGSQVPIHAASAFGNQALESLGGQMRGDGPGAHFASHVEMMMARQATGRSTVADEMKRQTRFTPPRTVVLNTKYDGAVTINVWNGYAVLVVGSDGQRRVVKGPAKLLLQYDEALEPQAFSTGKPKNTDNLLRTAYLKYQHNQVSDIVPITTKDLVKVQLKVSYRVNFEGDPIKWFAVDNYVKFICDRLRSMLNNAAMKVGIEEFMATAHDLVRNTVLGEKQPDKPREGRLFVENGVRIYDVELLKTTVGDAEGTNAGTDIIGQLTAAQHATVTNLIRIKAKEAELLTVQREEQIKQEIEFARQDTQDKILELKTRAVQKNHLLNSAQQNAVSKLELEKLELDLSKQQQLDQIQAAQLQRNENETAQRLKFHKEDLQLELTRMTAETASFKEKAAAVSDKMVAAIQSASDKDLAMSIAQSTAPLAYLRNVSAAEAFNGLVHGLPGVSDILGDTIRKALGTDANKALDKK